MPMAKKNEMATNANLTTKQSTSKAKLPMKDPRSPVQYLTDRTIEAAGNELDRLEQETPGTRRKLAGITSLGVGVTGITAGVYLLIT